MSSTFGAEPAAGSDFAAGSPYRGHWGRGRRCGASWTAAELLAMVLGFMVYWPIGLAIIGWKMIQRRRGPGENWFEAVRESFGGTGFRSGFGWGQSGNSAFDAWRATEIERLEAERRKLEEAQRAFAEFAEEARRARDRDEFERFMARRPQV